MIKRNIRGIADLGRGLRYLMERQAGDLIIAENEGGVRGVYVLSAINALLKRLDEYGFRVTLVASKNLKSLRDKFKEMEPGSYLSPEHATDLHEISQRLSHTFNAEASTIYAFFVRDKHISTDKLIDNPRDLLNKGVFDKLSDIARYDIQEAAKSLAFELNTAAAFHILRATEEVIKIYYNGIVKRDRVKKLMWFKMTDHLGKRRLPPPKLILDNLDFIRTRFRNPTAHPDYIYTISEAQAVFNLCIDAINRIVNDSKWTNT